MLELGSGLNPDLTGIQNIYFGGIMLGISPEEMKTKVDKIIAFAEIGDFINQPMKTYSSGMKARLGFALAVNINPDILVIDEILSVGDDLFRRKCYARMEDFFKGGKTILFVSHDLNSINQLCTRAILVDKGECILEGPANMVTMYYQKLLYAVKGKGADVRREIVELNKNESLKQRLYQETEKVKADSKSKISNINSNGNEKVTPDRQKNRPTDNITKQKAYYIPGLKPKSTVEYRNYDVDIYDQSIKNIYGEKVNVLITGEYYEYCYRVKFNFDCNAVLFGMGFKNEKSLVISGITEPNKNEPISYIHKATEYIVTIKFKCNLQQGNYYVDIGVTGIINDERVFLNRIVDASVFRVMKTGHNYWGFVILEQNMLIKKIG